MKTIDAHVAKRYRILKATGATVWEIVWRTPSNIKKGTCKLGIALKKGKFPPLPDPDEQGGITRIIPYDKHKLVQTKTFSSKNFDPIVETCECFKATGNVGTTLTCLVNIRLVSCHLNNKIIYMCHLLQRLIVPLLTYRNC